jgi:hypothetical protein
MHRIGPGKEVVKLDRDFSLAYAGRRCFPAPWSRIFALWAGETAVCRKGCPLRSFLIQCNSHQNTQILTMELEIRNLSKTYANGVVALDGSR